MALRGYPQYSPFSDVIGNDIDAAVAPITSPMHHVVTTATLTTLSPPQAMLGFIGPVYLIADTEFTWDTSGNIAAMPGTTVCVDTAYCFVYEHHQGKWYPVDGLGCYSRAPV